MKTCEHCGTGFEPSENSEQVYCRPQCARAAHRRRAKDRKQLSEILAGRICPSPYKRTYRTWEEAATRTWELGNGMIAYRCQCGAIHYGHPGARQLEPQLIGANQ